MKRTVTIVLYICSHVAVVCGQEVNVTAAFDSSKIYLGDHVNFTVTVDKPLNYPLSVPVFKDTIRKNIEILNGPLVDTSFLKDGRIRIREKYLVTSFDSGFYQVPPVYAEVRSESGIKRFYSDYSRLMVMRVKIAPADTTARIFDIIKPYKAPLTVGEVLPWVLLGLLAAAVIWFTIRFIRKSQIKKSGEEPVINPDPAHIIAFRELEKLKEEKLWQKGEIKKYYTRLTEIVRQYLENRFSILSMELTTPETLVELKKTGFREDENYRMLRTVLTGADLVKFAKYNPEPSENDLHFEYAWEFVKLTKIEDQVAVENIENEQKKEEVV
jgi:hypothetical protein